VAIDARQLADHIVAQLRAAGHTAWLVGGCVRDLLLGLQPKDYDVATSATPEACQKLFPDSVAIGAHFGVVLVRDEEASVEVATYRIDGDYEDGRRPASVAFATTPQEDASRRDFTINAMMMDPVTGEVLDFFGGREDLAGKCIRAIGDPAKRFAEDHLRLLRAVRFAARFGYEIEPATFAAMLAQAPALATIAAERIREELTCILTQGHADRGVQLLSDTGLLAVVLPEVEALHGVQQPPQFHPEGDVWTHVLLMLKTMGPAEPTLAWGVLLHDVGKPGTFKVTDRIRFDGHADLGVEIGRGILNRLRFSGDDTEQILALVQNHMRFMDIQRMKQSTLKRFLRMPAFGEHLRLHELDCAGSNGRFENLHYAREQWQSLPAEALNPPRLVTGADLQAMGLVPGPQFREMLQAVEEAQLEGTVQSKKEAIAMLRRAYSL
jgi:tRNA nucleotidyltransferase/poly(A) polymerase